MSVHFVGMTNELRAAMSEKTGVFQRTLDLPVLQLLEKAKQAWDASRRDPVVVLRAE